MEDFKNYISECFFIEQYLILDEGFIGFLKDKITKALEYIGKDRPDPIKRTVEKVVGIRTEEDIRKDIVKLQNEVITLILQFMRTLSPSEIRRRKPKEIEKARNRVDDIISRLKENPNIKNIVENFGEQDIRFIVEEAMENAIDMRQSKLERIYTSMVKFTYENPEEKRKLEKIKDILKKEESFGDEGPIFPDEIDNIIIGFLRSMAAKGKSKRKTGFSGQVKLSTKLSKIQERQPKTKSILPFKIPHSQELSTLKYYQPPSSEEEETLPFKSFEKPFKKPIITPVISGLKRGIY